MSVSDEDRKRVQELEEKIHKLRMEKLLSIEYVEEAMKATANKIGKLEDKLQGYQEKLTSCDLKEIRRYEKLITAVKVEAEILGQQKQMLNVLRLLIKNVQKEQEYLTYMKAKLGVT